MPIVTVEALEPSHPNSISDMIKEIRNFGAEALQSKPDNIWVIFHSLNPSHAAYPHPPVVIVKAQSGRTKEQRTAFVKIISEAVGKALSQSSENIWVHFQEMSPQDIWFSDHWTA